MKRILYTLLLGLLLIGLAACTQQDGNNGDSISGADVLSAPPEAAVELMREEDLIDRTLYLFDPYVNPVSWWTASGTVSLDVYEIDVDPLEDTPEHTRFYQVLRFNSIDEVKRATEQAVTKEMAEKLYHNIEDLPPYFLERDGALYLNTEIGAGTPPFAPASASVISKTENKALLSVIFLGPDNEVEVKEVELVREKGTWKLNNHPYYDFLDREQK